MNKLVYIFNLIIIRTYKARKKDAEFCPIQYWKELKDIILKYNTQATKWSKVDKRISNKILNEPEYYINGHGDKTIDECNHYLIEHMRIPANSLPKLDKILEIAFSIGMVRALSNQSYLKKVNYAKYKLDKITTYLSNYDIKTVSNSIPDELVEEIKAHYKIEE